METREHVLPLLDHIAESRVVDDDGVESVDVECALSGGRHRQEVGLLRFAFEEGADDPDRLAAVVERAVDAWKAIFHQLRGFFHAGTRRQKHSDSSALLGYLL